MGSAALLFGWFAAVQELRFKLEKLSDIGCAELQRGCYKWYFEAAKCSKKGGNILQDGQFADAQESLFYVSKSSNVGSAVLLGGRSASVQEFSFQTAKRSDTGCAELQGVY